jgi:uncharacterized coiled-coil DUF342 family protein
MEVTIDPRILNKVLLICQKNSTKLDQISKRQDEMEAMMVEQREMMAEQKDKIDQILSKFEVQSNADNKVVKDKGKKSKNEFYQVNIYVLLLILFVYTIYLYFN